MDTTAKNDTKCKMDENCQTKNSAEDRQMENIRTLNIVRKKLQTFQTTVLSDVQNKMDGMIEEIDQEMREYQQKTNAFREFAKDNPNNEIWSNRQINTNESRPNRNDSKYDKKNKLPDKVFIARESYLTGLLEVDHMRSIYHIFLVLLTILFLNTTINDYFQEGQITLGFRTIKSGFTDIHLVFGIWSIMQITSYGIYYAFQFWATARYPLRKYKAIQTFFDYSCIVVFVCFQLTYLYVGSMGCIKLDLPFPSSSVLILETIRMIMKMHAFVRTNAGQQLEGKQKTDKKGKTNIPVRIAPFKSYLYYLFAPTFIYRESYPRTKQIRWKFALARITEWWGVILVFSYMFERYMYPTFVNFGIEPLTKAQLITKIFDMLMPAAVIFVCGFYLLLHSWLNFTSEILRFADRMFYKDWWTASTYDAYYRNWNVVVHDWLYEYVYKDVYLHVFKGSKLLSSLTVFFVSAVVHEHVLAVSLKFFYPIIYFCFGVMGVGFLFLSRTMSKRLGNIFIWFSLLIGNGIIYSLYLMEFYARRNCPVGNSLKDFFIPVSWSCNGLIDK